MIDINLIKNNYQSLTDHELIELARADGKELSSLHFKRRIHKTKVGCKYDYYN
jgi:hypothetical protein